MHRVLPLFGLLLLLLAAGSAGGSTLTTQLRDPVWSPDGTRIAWIRDRSGEGRIYVADLAGRHAHAVTPSLPFPHEIAWSRDASALAYVADRHLWRLDLATGHTLQLTDAQFEDVSAPDWSPDGTTIAYANFEGCFRCTAIHLVDAAGGNDRVLVAPVGGVSAPRRPRWNRDGTQLLTSQPVDLVDVPSGTVHPVANGFSASWSGDHTVFVFVGDGVQRSESGRQVPPQTLWKGGFFAFPTLNPAATRLAVVRTRAVWERRLDGSAPVRLPRSDSPSSAPAWSFRGALAYVADGRCGPRSEIDVSRPDGTHPHAVARSC